MSQAVERATEPDALPTLEKLVGLVQTVRRWAVGTGRTDLAQRLEQTHERLRDPEVRVVVVGEFKQGKSKLVNALVNAPVCPIDDDVATSVPTSVGYGEQPRASVLVRLQDSSGGRPQVQRQPIPLEELANYVSELGNPGNTRGLLAAEVVLPREILKGGLRVVDSPGLGGLDSARALTTLSTLASAHAVLLVSDASQEYTEPEVQLLRHAMRISPNVAAVLAKTDLYPEWRTIERIDLHHLESIGKLPLFPISSDLRLMAASEQDPDLNNESGFPQLVAHLRQEVVRKAEVLNARGAIHDLVFVLDQMSLAAKTELTALVDPDARPQLIVQLEEAKARAEEFRGRASRWQVALGDGIADLIADMEHDLRDRLRRVQREAEDAIEEGDPAPIWEQITEWIDQRVAAAVSETFVWADERGQWLVREIADLFRDEEPSLPPVDIGATDGVLDGIDELPKYGPAELPAAEKIYIGLRGSYGGVLMTGMVTGLIGMSLINPVSMLVGVLVGRRAYREDSNARLMRRRFDAKNLVRRHIDEITFQVGKQLKDRMRLLQRTARDHFGAIADEMHRSLAEAVQSAKQSATAYTEQRDKRVEDLKSQLRQLDQVRAQLPALEPLLTQQAVDR